MGGATAIAFAHAHPQMSRAVLICNIDGGHQPYDRGVGSETDQLRKRGRRIVEKRGLVDYARRIIERKLAPRFVMESEAQQANFIERYARQPQNGFFGAGDARPWTEPWLKEAAANLSMPVAILAAQEDELHQGAELLHAALPDSHFVSIAEAPHDAMNARPAAFNTAFLDYLDSLEAKKPLSGRRTM